MRVVVIKIIKENGFYNIGHFTAAVLCSDMMAYCIPDRCYISEGGYIIESEINENDLH